MISFALSCSSIHFISWSKMMSPQIKNQHYRLLALTIFATILSSEVASKEADLSYKGRRRVAAIPSFSTIRPPSGAKLVITPPRDRNRDTNNVYVKMEELTTVPAQEKPVDTTDTKHPAAESLFVEEVAMIPSFSVTPTKDGGIHTVSTQTEELTTVPAQKKPVDTIDAPQPASTIFSETIEHTEETDTKAKTPVARENDRELSSPKTTKIYPKNRPHPALDSRPLTAVLSAQLNALRTSESAEALRTNIDAILGVYQEGYKITDITGYVIDSDIAAAIQGGMRAVLEKNPNTDLKTFLYRPKSDNRADDIGLYNTSIAILFKAAFQEFSTTA